MKTTLEPYELEDWELTQRKLGRREFDGAEFFVRHRISRHGLRPTYAALLAQVLKRAGKYNAALSTLDEGLEQYPNSMRLHAEKGDTHFARMEYVLAADEYAKALSAGEEDCTNPNAKEFVQDNLAMSRYFLGDAAGAAELIRPLLLVHPEKIRYRKHYTQALAQSAGEDVSLSDLPDIDVLHAPELGALLCWRLLDEKRFYDALRCSEQLTAKYPGNPQSIRCRADVLYRLLRFDEAVDILENAIRQHVDADLYATLAKSYIATRQIRLAREACLAGAFHFPDNLKFLLYLLEIDQSLGRPEECRKYCERIATIPRVWQRMSHRQFKEISALPFGMFEFPKTEEGARDKRRFEAVKNSWSLDIRAVGDPDKVALPKDDRRLRVVFRNNSMTHGDEKSAHCTIENGCRVVVNQPSEYARTVFLAGYCMTIFGAYNSVTLPSALQDVFNLRSNEMTRVVSYGGAGAIGSHENIYLRLIHSNELRSGDVVLWCDIYPSVLCSDIYYDNMLADYNCVRNELSRKGVRLYLGFAPNFAFDPFLTPGDNELHDALVEFKKIQSRKELKDGKSAFINRLTENEFTFSFFENVLLHKTPNAEGFFWRDWLHYSLSLNWPLAEAMYEFLSLPAKMKRTENLPSLNKRCMAFLQNTAFTEFLKNEGVRSWIMETHDAEISNHKNVGAIVMNCNPFTLGHRYLVEKALESVEALYLFVVEEDLSRFSFADRLMLVKEGVRDFGGRVKVVPSGKFIISSFSFTEYFTKAVEITPPDSTIDVLIFASMIAPALNIRTRFVGEEPTCMVTRSYNERMLELLPDMGCAVKVIPRKEVGGVAISASRVRKALEENDLESIKNLVPETTYKYLAKGTQHNIDYRTFLHFRQNHVVLNAMSA